MGTLQATEFASAVQHDTMSLETALTWHLTANHWPELPIEYVDVLAQAIRRYNSQEILDEDLVALPGDLKTVPIFAIHDPDTNTYLVEVGYLFDITHCWPFIEEH